MTNTIKVSSDGTIVRMAPVSPFRFYVHVDEVIPKGIPIGSTAFIVEKQEVAWCDGRDNWFVNPDISVAAGGSWSDFF